jgi:hypothetical protein
MKILKHVTNQIIQFLSLTILFFLAILGYIEALDTIFSHIH